jgi:peptidylprolyl isomerase
MTAKIGDNVAVHYTGRLLDGTVFDSSENREPLTFQVGAGQMIAGFDTAVQGMAVGETKFATLPPAEAYGEKDPEALIKVPAADVPEDIQPEVGMMLTLTDDYGRNHQVTVEEVTPEYIVLDANHHLAGKSLVFEITMVSIN